MLITCIPFLNVFGNTFKYELSIVNFIVERAIHI